MAALIKKEPNSDLYESDPSRSTQIPYTSMNYSQDSNARSNFDRARWSEQDMEILFGWFQNPQNLASYTNGVKAKAMRAMAEKIPGKTDRQVLNKMTALENHYHQCKTRLKQGIPLTERDLECGIDSARAKVKSIFRYYYEMDQILGSQPQPNSADNGYSHSSRPEDQNDYDSPHTFASNGTPQVQQISHHSLGERISPLLPSAPIRGYPTSRGYTPEAYPQETYPHESFAQPKYGTHATNGSRTSYLEATNDSLPSISSIRSEGHSYPPPENEASTNPGASHRDSSDYNLTLAPLNSRHAAPAPDHPEIHSEKARIMHGSKSSSSSRKERRLKNAEDRLAFKRTRHQEIMSLAYRQFEAEEEARKISQQQHQELLEMRRLEYQLRSQELALEKARFGDFAGPRTHNIQPEPHIVISAAEPDNDKSPILNGRSVSPNISRQPNSATEGAHSILNQIPLNP